MSTMAKPRDIHLHIDSLVLEGFTGIDTAALTEALRENLTTQLRACTGTWQNVELRRAQGTIFLPSRFGTAQLSMALAQTLGEIVYGNRQDDFSATERNDG